MVHSSIINMYVKSEVLIMPGIVGMVDPENRVDSNAIVKQMFKAMRHEEFYLTDRFSNPPITLGRIHLGILNPERQPIFNEEGEKCIVMDGEIYNSKYLLSKLHHKHDLELENDPELVLHLYEEFGLKFLNLLNGSFALAIWDDEKKQLIVANDRYGLIPIYYIYHDGMFVFAPEIKGILKIDFFPRILNEKAVADFFTFGYLLGDKTFLKGIKLFPPASICVVNGRNARLAVKKYWDFQFQEDKSIDVENAVSKLNALLRKAVNIRAYKKERLGIALTGGIDSRTILAAMNDDLRDRIFAFTFGIKGTYDERISRIISDRLGLKHIVYESSASQYKNSVEKIAYITDGMYLGWGTYLAGQELKKNVDIILVGCGGGLLRGGYLSKRIMEVSSQEELFRVLFKKINRIIPHSQQKTFFSKEYDEVIALSLNNLREELSKAKGSSFANKLDYFFLRNRIRRFVFLGLAQARSLLEVRTPFFDNDLIEFIQRIPASLRFDARMRRQLFQTHYPMLSKISIHSSSNGYLDRGSLKWNLRNQKRKIRKKLARTLLLKDPYTPLNIHNRFRTDLRDFVERVLLDPRTLNRPLFNSRYIEKLVQTHMKGKKDLGLQLETLITFELWQRMFMEG